MGVSAAYAASGVVDMVRCESTSPCHSPGLTLLLELNTVFPGFSYVASLLL